MATRRKKRIVANTVADPTLGTADITIAGKTYTLCFDMGALAEAELHFRRAGEDVHLLSAFPQASLASVLILFPCAIHKFHPEISFKEAQEIVSKSMTAIYATAALITVAWKNAMPEGEPGAPKSKTPPSP